MLVVINAFGGDGRMERSIVPKIADAEFHIAAKTAILSFIIVFGVFENGKMRYRKAAMKRNGLISNDFYFTIRS